MFNVEYEWIVLCAAHTASWALIMGLIEIIVKMYFKDVSRERAEYFTLTTTGVSLS